VHSNIVSCYTGPALPAEHARCHCWRAVLFLETRSSTLLDIWNKHQFLEPLMDEISGLQKKPCLRKYSYNILALLLEFVRDYSAAKSSLQKFKAQKEKAEENSRFLI